jgi:putative FmdB family regulatory protein
VQRSRTKILPEILSAIVQIKLEKLLMPTYEYTCQNCGHELEAWQKMSDPVLTECPECKQNSLKKQISAAGFQLKGNGWYATDFKNSGTKPEKAEKAGKAETSDKSENAKSETSKDSTKTDSKNTASAST